MRDIVVVGASAGGVTALRQLAASLPADYGGALCIVMHISPDARSELPAILAKAGALPAVHAEDGMAIEAGRLHVAPPDCHLLVERGALRVVRGPRENRHRPAIDPLFRSAAWTYGPRTVGVVLTGRLDDGTGGLWAIKSCGGTTIVQDPDTAEYPEMPANAMALNTIDHCVALDAIAPLLVRLAAEPAAAPAPNAAVAAAVEAEVEPARLQGRLDAMNRIGALSPFTCPSCRGALWEIDEAGHLRYRCHTGHAFSHASLLADQGRAVEEAVYTALRAVVEKAAGLRRLAERWPDRIPGISRDYEERARELDETAEVLRGLLAGAAH
jgi:two-component system chemotaxis response regulator CheB